MSKNGRPSYYETNIKPMLPAAKGWYMKGISKKVIAAELLGISESTFYKYQSEHTEFSECFKKGKEVANYEVVNALHENATGYYRKEQVVTSKRKVIYKDGKRVSEVTEPVVVEVQKWYPMNVTAQIYYTKNRMPDEWNDKKEVKADMDGGDIVFNIMPASQKPVDDDESEE